MINDIWRLFQKIFSLISAIPGWLFCCCFFSSPLLLSPCSVRGFIPAFDQGWGPWHSLCILANALQSITVQESISKTSLSMRSKEENKILQAGIEKPGLNSLMLGCPRPSAWHLHYTALHPLLLRALPGSFDRAGAAGIFQHNQVLPQTSRTSLWSIWGHI